MGIKPTEGEVRALAERYSDKSIEGPIFLAYANLLAEQANAVPVGELSVRLSHWYISSYSELVQHLPAGKYPVYLHPPKDTNPLNHSTQDLYEHFLAVHKLDHTDDLRKAFYHGAGEHTPEELAGFLAKGESHD